MLSKPLIITLFVSISLNCLFGYLSYSFYSDKAVAESRLDAAVDANKGLQLSLEKKETACKITDIIVSEYQAEKQEIVKEKDRDLNAIDKMLSMAIPADSKQKRQENAKEQTDNKQTDVVSLDGGLPVDLVRLLSEHCLRAKGSPCSAP